MHIKKNIFGLGFVVLASGALYAGTESLVINNESGIDITVQIEYEDASRETHALSSGEKKPYADERCIYAVSIYSERWRSVAEIESDDKLVIPEEWKRCQSWLFTIKKRIDGTVHIADKKPIPASNVS